MKTGRKKIEPLPVRAAKKLRRLKDVRGLSEEEKSIYALGLAATPQERWEVFEASMRSFAYWKPLRRRKSGSQSKQVIGRDRDKWHIGQIQEFLRCQRALKRKR